MQEFVFTKWTRCLSLFRWGDGGQGEGKDKETINNYLYMLWQCSYDFRLSTLITVAYQSSNRSKWYLRKYCPPLLKESSKFPPLIPNWQISKVGQPWVFHWLSQLPFIPRTYCLFSLEVQGSTMAAMCHPDHSRHPVCGRVCKADNRLHGTLSKWSDSTSEVR